MYEDPRQDRAANSRLGSAAGADTSASYEKAAYAQQIAQITTWTINTREVANGFIINLAGCIKNKYYDREWGNKAETASVYDPDAAKLMNERRPWEPFLFLNETHVAASAQGATIVAQQLVLKAMSLDGEI